MHGTYIHTCNPKKFGIAKIPNEIVVWNRRSSVVWIDWRNDIVLPSPYQTMIQRSVGKVVWEWNWPARPRNARASIWNEHIIFHRQRKNTTRQKKGCNLRESSLWCQIRKDGEKTHTIDVWRRQDQLSRQRKHTNSVLTNSEAVIKQCHINRGRRIHDTRH